MAGDCPSGSTVRSLKTGKKGLGACLNTRKLQTSNAEDHRYFTGKVSNCVP